jgi:hypothetical protein
LWHGSCFRCFVQLDILSATDKGNNAMKSAKLALALTAITLLSSPAIAGVIEDPLLVSFERDMNYEASRQPSRPLVREEIDPLVEALRAALSNPVKPEPHQGAAVGRNGG